MNITKMCKAYLAEQRELLAKGDTSALAPRTLRDYIEALEHHIIPMFGHMKPSAFRPMHAAQYLHAAKKGSRGVRGNREVAALASAFNHGMVLGLVESNPCRGVRRNKERPRKDEVTIAEVNAMMALAEGRGGAALMVALIAVTVALIGRRRGEILELKHDALLPDGIEVLDHKVSRFGERRYLVQWSPLLREVVTKAGQVRPVGDFVFPTRTGQPYTDSGFKTEWNKLQLLYFAQHGHRFRAHDLRALYVSEMLNRGENPNTHQNENTMRRVYDRRKVVRVTPLA